MTTARPLFVIVAVMTCASALNVRAQTPTTQPTDAVDFILSGATTSPSTPTTAQASTSPTTPFAAQPEKSARTATFTFSDGSAASGTVTTTLDKPLRIWVEAKGEFVDVPFANVVSAKAYVIWEREDKEYQFLTSGSDVKTYTGRTYPARETGYEFRLVDGKTVKGSVVVPFGLSTDAGAQRLVVLHKRDKGPAGKTLKDLVYVTEVKFGK